MPVKGALTLNQSARPVHKDGAPWICGQQNVKASARDNTGQDTDKGQTPSPRIGIKILEPTENRTRAPGIEGRDSTDNAMATDLFYAFPIHFCCICKNFKLIVEKLHILKVLSCINPDDVVQLDTCSRENMNCVCRLCNQCLNKLRVQMDSERYEESVKYQKSTNKKKTNRNEGPS